MDARSYAAFTAEDDATVVALLLFVADDMLDLEMNELKRLTDTCSSEGAPLSSNITLPAPFQQ